MTGENTKDDRVKDIKTHIIEWAAGQPFNNVLLIVILTSIGWIGHYSMTIAIPSHLKQIQDGYQSLDVSHQKERQQTLETYDRWVDRLAAKKIQDAASKSEIASGAKQD